MDSRTILPTVYLASFWVLGLDRSHVLGLFGHVFVPNGMCHIHLRVRSLQGVIVSQAPCECGLLAGRSWEDKGVDPG